MTTLLPLYFLLWFHWQVPICQCHFLTCLLFQMRVNDNGRIWPECTEPRQVGVLKKFRSMSESVHFLSLLEKSNQFLPTWCWYFPSHLVAEPAGRNRFWVGRRGSVNTVVVWWKLLSGFHVRTYTYILAGWKILLVHNNLLWSAWIPWWDRCTLRL